MSEPIDLEYTPIVKPVKRASYFEIYDDASTNLIADFDTREELDAFLAEWPEMRESITVFVWMTEPNTEVVRRILARVAAIPRGLPDRDDLVYRDDVLNEIQEAAK